MPRNAVGTDTFTYSNGRLSTVSSNWEDLHGTVTYTSVSTEKVANAFSTLAPTRWKGAGTWAADQYAKVTVSGLPSSVGKCGVIVRASADTGSNRDFYFAYVDCANNYDNVATVVGRVVDGTSADLSRTTADGWVDGDTIALEIEGAGPVTWRVYRNDVLLRSGSDTSGYIAGSAAHKPGLILSDTTNRMRLDDWEGGGLTVPARKVSLHLVNRSGVEQANAAGLKVFVWDFNTVTNIASQSPDDSTAQASTDANGFLNFTLTNCTTPVDGTVLVLVTDCDGNPLQSPATRASFRAVTVVAA